MIRTLRVDVVTVFDPTTAGKSNILRVIAFGAWFVGKIFDLRPGHDLPCGRWR